MVKHGLIPMETIKKKKLRLSYFTTRNPCSSARTKH